MHPAQIFPYRLQKQTSRELTILLILYKYTMVTPNLRESIQNHHINFYCHYPTTTKRFQRKFPI